MYEKILKVCILILRGNTHYEWPAHSPSQSVTVLLTAFSALHTQRGAALPLLLALTTCYLLYHLTTDCLLLTTYCFTPQAELRCPSFLPADVKSLIEGLLIRDPLKRLGSGETDIKELEARGSK